MTSVLGLWIWIFWDTPTLSDLPRNMAVPSVRITDRYGRILYELIDKSGGRHTPVSIQKIPEDLKKATIATEDRSFYQNPGVDIFGIIRAFWINLQGGETLAGGSTITQQVAKNLLLTKDEQVERTLRRKLRESWLAWKLTREFTKDEILGLYLNQMNYGALAYGVEAAAQTYFGKSVSELDLAECALIAGIPQGPAVYNPLVYPQAALNRQHIVLELMLNQGSITKEQYEMAYHQPMIYNPAPYPMEAPHFILMVIAQVDELLPERTLKAGNPIVVRTTLNLDWQHLAERAISRHLQALRDTNTNLSTGGPELGHNVPGGHNVNNAALVAIDPNNGEILALIGSPDYFDGEHAGAINMAIMPRQPGSALKPFVYAAALDPKRAQPYTAATMLLDVRHTFTTHEGDAYTPANYDNLEHGPVSTRQALASSLNIPAVITLDSVGLSSLFDLSSSLGISTFGNPDDYDLSLALGGGEVNLLELSAAYGAFANNGSRLDPYSIQRIATIEGEILYQNGSHTSIQVIDPRVAWLISDILNDNDARAIGFGTNSALKLDRPAAVKTGTTTNYHDNWTVGYTPDLVVGVWVGNANHEPMRAVTGLSGAGPIWHQFTREALTGQPQNWFVRPQGMRQIEVCALSGQLPSDACPYTKHEWFIEGTEPINQDTIYQWVWIDLATGAYASDNTQPDSRVRMVALDLPPLAQPWARSQGLILLNDLSQHTLNRPTWDEYPLQIIAPGDNTTYRANTFLDPDAQQLHIEAASSLGLNWVELWVDNSLLARIQNPPFEAWWPLQVGQHTTWAQAETKEGHSIQSPILTFRVEGSSLP